MSESMETSSYVDSSVGTLVWVRRRNGSWWPGRILGPDELPGSHLLSPRSGTPVKLLGREDASVDWYNIEKSRRVKAFRCGEFDDCIERAKALASLLKKKREKYARREDAILHALELEQKQFEERHLSGGVFRGRNSGEPSDSVEDAVLDDDIERIGRKSSDFGSDFIGPESFVDAAQSVVSIPKASQGNVGGLFGPRRDKKIPDSEWEDDITEATPRMRGLQDFGLRIASSKGRRANWSNACESVPKASLLEDETKMVSCISKSVGTCTLPNSAKASCSALKRKRSQAGPSADESAYKRRDRRRPLTQVLESSAKLAEGIFPELDIGSKDFVPPFIPSQENGFIIMHPNQERNSVLSDEPFHGSDDLESPSGRQGFELQQASQNIYKSKQEMLDSASIMDKACSSFSSHINTNCCDGRPLYLGSQMEVAPLSGSAFVDSLLRGGPASACSFMSGSAHTGSATSVNDTGFDKSSSISMASKENLPHSSSFQVWPNYSIREAICDKRVNELGVAARTANRAPWTSGCLPNSKESAIPSNALPLYSPHNKGLEDHKSALCKRSVDDLESSFRLSRSDINADMVKNSNFFPRQGTFSANERVRGRVTGEDEAESFQAITGPSLSSQEALAAHSTGNAAKQDSVIEGKSDVTEVRSTAGLESGLSAIHSGVNKSDSAHQFELSHGLACPGRNRNEGLDETGFCSFFNRGNPSDEDSSMTAKQTVSKWQAKGRRNARVLGRKPFDSFHRRGLVHFGEGNDGLVDESERCQEEAGGALFDMKPYDRSDKGERPRFKLEMYQVHQDDKEPAARLLLGGEASWGCEKDLSCALPDTDWESAQHVSKVHDSVRGNFDTRSSGNRRSMESSWVQRSFDSESLTYQQSNLIELRDSTWIDVPIEVRATYQGEHVPLVSLMSKLNGKAIVGHPVLVERLERRYEEGHSGVRNLAKKTFSGGKGKKVPFQPVWRTARRTAMQRVPRSCSSMVNQECEDTAVQPISRLGYAGLFTHKNRLMRKSVPLTRCPSLDKRFSKKFSKKLGSSSQKTRMLSSIAVDHTVKLENTESVNYQKISGVPTVTCIPVQVVFSRIREVLYGQSKPVVSDSNKLLVNASDMKEPT